MNKLVSSLKSMQLALKPNLQWCTTSYSENILGKPLTIFTKVDISQKTLPDTTSVPRNLLHYFGIELYIKWLSVHY